MSGASGFVKKRAEWHACWKGTCAPTLAAPGLGLEARTHLHCRGVAGQVVCVQCPGPPCCVDLWARSEHYLCSAWGSPAAAESLVPTQDQTSEQTPWEGRRGGSDHRLWCPWLCDRPWLRGLRQSQCAFPKVSFLIYKINKNSSRKGLHLLLTHRGSQYLAEVTNRGGMSLLLKCWGQKPEPRACRIP